MLNAEPRTHHRPRGVPDFARDPAKVEDQVRFLARTLCSRKYPMNEQQLPFEMETDLEREIARQTRWQAGVEWGRPRHGHPEGTVKFHIAAVLANIERWYADDPYRRELRLIALVHDAFKGEVNIDEPRTGENHHGLRARRFAEDFIHDTNILDVIELHDHAYNAWQRGSLVGNWNAAERRAAALLSRLGDATDLYSRFYHCDNETEGKDQECFLWFREFVERNRSSQ
jgi:hypothetical protein